MRELDEKRNLAMERLAELQVEGGKAMEIESEARAQEQIAGKKLRQLHKCKSNCLSLWLRLQDIFQELVGAKTLVNTSIFRSLIGEYFGSMHNCMKFYMEFSMALLGGLGW